MPLPGQRCAGKWIRAQPDLVGRYHRCLVPGWFDSIHLFSAGKWTATTNVGPVDAQWRKTITAYNTAHGTQRIWAAGVIPGWDESRVQPPRTNAKVYPRRDGALYTETWQGAMASNPEWITITSYNEWFEGTQIEPSVTYGTRYLTLTRQLVDQWKGINTPTVLPATTTPPAISTAGPTATRPTAGTVVPTVTPGPTIPRGWHKLSANGASHLQEDGELLAAVRRTGAVRLPD